MPREVIQWVTEMGRQQGMPATLTFADRHGRELEDRLVEIPDDDATQEAYDPYYDDESTHTGDDGLSYDTEDDGDDDDNDGHSVPVPGSNDHGMAVAPDCTILDNDPALFGPDVTPGAGNDDQHSHVDPSNEPLEAPDDLRSTGVVDNEADECTVEKDEIDVDDASKSTGVEDDTNSGFNDNPGVGVNITPTVEADTHEESLVDATHTQPGPMMSMINDLHDDTRTRQKTQPLSILIRCLRTWNLRQCSPCSWSTTQVKCCLS